MKERQEDGRFCRAYLRTMDPERAAAEINRRDGYTMLGRKTTQQHLEQMRSAAAGDSEAGGHFAAACKAGLRRRGGRGASGAGAGRDRTGGAGAFGGI